MIKEYLGACFILVTVFTFGYILAERFIPKTNKSFSIFIVTCLLVGLSLLFVFPESIRLKALAFSIAWLAVIWINKKRKLPSLETLEPNNPNLETPKSDETSLSEPQKNTQE